MTQLDVSNVAALVVTLLVFYVGMRYCGKVVRKEIYPRIATWLIFEVGVIMSLATYLAGHDHTLAKAALNAADCLQVTVILTALGFAQRGQKIRFTESDWASLAISCVAAVVWIVTRTGAPNRSAWLLFTSLLILAGVVQRPGHGQRTRFRSGRPWFQSERQANDDFSDRRVSSSIPRGRGGRARSSSAPPCLSRNTGWKDPDVLKRVAERDYTLVTNNAADFRRLYANLDLHAGLIIIVPDVIPKRQQTLLGAVLDHLGKRALVNTVVELGFEDDRIAIVEYDLPDDR